MKATPLTSLVIVAALLTITLGSPAQTLSQAQQEWPPKVEDLLALPRGGGGPPPVNYLEPIGQVGGTTRAIAVQGDLAFAGNGPRLLVLNVSDPGAPALVGATAPLESLVSKVVVSGKVAYVTAAEGGLLILDIGEPAHPRVLGTFDTPGPAHSLAVSGTVAFVAGDAAGLHIVDVSQPASPTLLATWDSPGSVTGVKVIGDLAFLSDLTEGLQVVDVGDPSAPQPVGALDTPGKAWGLDVAGTAAYIADEVGGLRVIDISDPVHPAEIASVETVAPTDVVVDGSVAYLADWWSGLRLVDVSDPADPVELGQLDTPGYALQVAVQSSGRGRETTTTAYVADGDGGLRIVAAGDPAHPLEIGFFGTLGFSSSVVVSGSLAYVAGGYSGLHILDVANGEQPQEIGHFDLADCVDVDVAGTSAYVVADNSLVILAVDDPTSPTLLSSLPLPGRPQGVVVGQDTAYVAAGQGGLRVVDVADAAHPQEIGSLALPGTARRLALRGATAYIAAGEAGLQIVDISNPHQPVLISAVDTPGTAWDVIVPPVERYALVADWDGGLRSIDISDAGHPREVFVLAMRGEVAGVEFMPQPTQATRGGLLVVAIEGAGLSVVDAANPAFLSELLAQDTPGGAEAVTTAGSTALVADGAGGLTLVRLLRDRQETTITPAGGSLAAADASLVAIFPAGAFGETVTMTFRRLAVDENTDDRLGIGLTYRLDATSATSGLPAALVPGKDYAVVLRYSDWEKGPIVEETLQLLYREAGQWLPESTSLVHVHANAITALPYRLGWWSVQGETKRHYFPLVTRHGETPIDFICHGVGSITLWHGWSGAEADALNMILGDWSSTCPSIQIDAQAIGTDLKQAFIAAAAAGGGPDFLLGPGDWIGELAEAGLVKPLDGFQVNVVPLMPAALEALRHQGSLYAVPASVELVALYYNKDLVSAPPTSLEGLLTAAEQGGLALNYGFYHGFWGIPAHGGGLFDENGSCILDQGGFPQWLDWLAVHQDDAGVTLGRDYGLLNAMFREGEAALYPDGPWALSAAVADLGADKVGVAPLPAGPDAPAGPLVGVRSLIFSNVPDDNQTRLALEFARFLTDVPRQRRLMNQVGHIPVNLTVAPANEWVAGFIAQAATAYPMPTTPNLAAVWVPGDNAYTQVLQGTMTGQEAALEACAAIDGDRLSAVQPK